jgi:hypothetical protein
VPCISRFSAANRSSIITVAGNAQCRCRCRCRCKTLAAQVNGNLRHIGRGKSDNNCGIARCHDAFAVASGSVLKKTQINLLFLLKQQYFGVILKTYGIRMDAHFMSFRFPSSTSQMEAAMKAYEPKSWIRFLVLAVFGATLSLPAAAEMNHASLTQEKARLELEAAIEKSKADIAGYKKTQREADALADLGIRQKEAEAEKSALLAKILPTKIEAVSGAIDAKNFGAAGLILAIDLAKALAPRLCKVIDQGQTVLIYDTVTVAGMTSARLLDTQLALFQDALNKALQEDGDAINIDAFSMVIGMGAAVATGAIKSVVELASLFKTNITVSRTDFSEAKSLLLTAMADNCPEKLAGLGFGYIGELDTTAFDELRTKALQLLNDRAQLEARIVRMKQDVADEKDATKKQAMQTQLNDLSAAGKLVDGFIAVLKPNDIGDKSPLSVAARFLALSKRTANADVLDIDLKLEGLTIVRENIFTGQHLRLSATAITWYRLHERAGKIVKAGVWREMAKPVQVDLRGDDADSAFWSK